MSPDTQELESVKYIPLPYRLVPLESGRWGVFTSFSTNGKLDGTPKFLDESEVLSFLRQSFDRQKRINAERKKHEEALRRSEAAALDSLDLEGFTL